MRRTKRNCSHGNLWGGNHDGPWSEKDTYQSNNNNYVQRDRVIQFFDFNNTEWTAVLFNAFQGTSAWVVCVCFFFLIIKNKIIFLTSILKIMNF